MQMVADIILINLWQDDKISLIPRRFIQESITESHLTRNTNEIHCLAINNFRNKSTNVATCVGTQFVTYLSMFAPLLYWTW